MICPNCNSNSEMREQTSADRFGDHFSNPSYGLPEVIYYYCSWCDYSFDMEVDDDDYYEVDGQGIRIDEPYTPPTDPSRELDEDNKKGG